MYIIHNYIEVIKQNLFKNSSKPIYFLFYALMTTGNGILLITYRNFS